MKIEKLKILRKFCKNIKMSKMFYKKILEQIERINNQLQLRRLRRKTIFFFFIFSTEKCKL